MGQGIGTTVVGLSSTFVTQANAGLIASGEATFPRGECAASAPLSTGVLRLAYFTARRTETITKVRTTAWAAAAGATPTLCRVGIYTVADNGALTLVASTANTTSLWATTYTAYTTNLTASLSKVAGQAYAVGALCVTGAAAPSISSSFLTVTGSELIDTLPRVSGYVNGQTDLPASLAAGSVTGNGYRLYATLLP